MITIYRHRRNDTNEVFYVGIGKAEKRAYSKYSRNNHWKNIVNKVGYSVEIVTETDTWELACELEQLLIQEYGRKDLGLGTLVNMTDGGDGNFNPSIETRKKISDRFKGIKTGRIPKNAFKEGNTPWNKNLKGECSHLFNIKFTEEHKEKISNSKKGAKFTDKHKENLSKVKKESIKNKDGNNPAARKIINLETNQIFNTVKETALFYGVNTSTVTRWLNGKTKNKYNLKYYE